VKLVVTGASGFVGQRLVSSLAVDGHIGIATGRKPPVDLPSGWVGKGRKEVLDNTPASVEADAIIHLEVKQHVPLPSVTDIADFQRTNVSGTREWLDWASAAHVPRFVYVSSIKAVAGSTGPTFEDAPPARNDAYGESKAAAEAVVREWAGGSSERAAVILRLAPVYGPRSTANIAAFARRVLAGKRSYIGDGSTRKSILSLANAVAAIEHVTQNMRAGCDVFNVADETTATVAELASMIAQVGGAQAPRGVPGFVSLVAALVGDVVTATTGTDTAFNTRRLHALTETTIFPPDKLRKTGFVHPQSTAAGLREMVARIRAESG
jgi:UDP-glucose 4-epimerase